MTNDKKYGSHCASKATRRAAKPLHLIADGDGREFLLSRRHVVYLRSDFVPANRVEIFSFLFLLFSSFFSYSFLFLFGFLLVFFCFFLVSFFFFC